MTELVRFDEKTPQEWAEYCRNAERNAVEHTLEWCRRVYEAKQNLQITFREWADGYYTEYKYSALCQLSSIGEQQPRLFNIIKQKTSSNDWGALYQLTTLTDDEIEQLDRIDQRTN